MDTALAPDPNTINRPPRPEPIGRVVGIRGSQATVELTARNSADDKPTVGKFMGLMTGRPVIIGLITDIGERP